MGAPRLVSGDRLRGHCVLAVRASRAEARRARAASRHAWSTSRSDPVPPDRGPADAGPVPARARPPDPRRSPSTDPCLGLPALPGLVADRAARASVAAPAPLEVGLVTLSPAMGAEGVED